MSPSKVGPACVMPFLLPVSVAEKEALKKKKSNCLLASNSPRHQLQPGCLYPHPGGRRGRRGRGRDGCRVHWEAVEVINEGMKVECVHARVYMCVCRGESVYVARGGF